MHVEAIMVQTWRPSSREFGVALGGRDQWRMEEYLELVDLEYVDWEGGVMAVETRFIG